MMATACVRSNNAGKSIANIHTYLFGSCCFITYITLVWFCKWVGISIKTFFIYINVLIGPVKRQHRLVVLPVLARAAAFVDVVSASASSLATVARLTTSGDDLYEVVLLTQFPENDD